MPHVLKVSGGACTLWDGTDHNNDHYPTCPKARPTLGWLAPLLPVECTERVPALCPYRVGLMLSVSAEEAALETKADEATA